ncbi:MAG: T9SS type A sorting domain-containing protein, partial [Ignavibacteriae bacterium]|nr:T9SS type A sorting domain-containing protein [Ignavibacteriota bacterium]
TKFIRLVVYNILGKEVATLVNEKQSPGLYEVSWDGSAYPSGVYFYSLFADGNLIETKKMLMIK